MKAKIIWIVTSMFYLTKTHIVCNDNDNGRQFLLQDFENVIDKIEHTKNIVSNYEAFIGVYVEE